jgi:hypothetical protein
VLVPRLHDREAPFLRHDERVDEVHRFRRVAGQYSLDRRDGDRAEEILGQPPRLDRERSQAFGAHAAEMGTALGQAHPGGGARQVGRAAKAG